MILGGQQIKKLIDENQISVSPTPEIKEASVKIHFFESLVLKSKEFRLTKTKETIRLPQNIAGFYDGYTHLSRKGVITHLGSMFLDPGMNGDITLELFNTSDQDIAINENDRAGHIVLMEIKN